MPDSKNNETRLKAAGLRMALKLLPPDIFNTAPAIFENYLKERLSHVEPESGEAGVCYLIAPQQDGTLSVMTATLDEQNTVRRVVDRTDLGEIIRQIIDNLKEI